MTKEQFKSKVNFLHQICGVPYSEIAKRLNITGQYVSLMMNGRKPITENILQKAAQCEMLNNIFCGGGMYECSEPKESNN